MALYLNYAMSRIYGMTNIAPQGSYFPRNGLYLPSRRRCIAIVREYDKLRQQESGAAGASRASDRGGQD